MADLKPNQPFLPRRFRPGVCLALVSLAWVGLRAQTAVHPSLALQVQKRFLTAGSECAFTVTLQGASESARAAALGSLKINFPGLTNLETRRLDSEGRIVVKGRIERPGFFAFEVSAVLQGEALTARDYVVVASQSAPSTFDHTGYYVFLGRGDYWDETHKLALWRLEDWEDLVDWMAAQHMDTLFMLLNGYTLAYPSEKYPLLRDHYALNAKLNFLQKLIPYAHRQGVRIFLTLTTDDHAEEFGKLHPEAVRLNRDGYKPSPRALDLENPVVQRYITDMLEEVLTLYPDADGIVLHPTEEDPDRFGDDTKTLFYRETGKSLAQTDKAERYRWYNQKFAEFVSKLYGLARAKSPHLEMVMFNCWWQDDYVSIYKQLLPEKMKICVWYYGWDDRDSRKWPIWAWSEAFGSDRILYMPAGVAFLYPADPWQQMARHLGTDRLISTAEALGVRSCIFFAGWELGTDRDRLRDHVLTEFPSSSYVSGKREQLDLIEKLYRDYFAARRELFP